MFDREGPGRRQVAPGAFRKSLAEHKRSRPHAAACCGRTTLTEPIGRWTDIRETAEGLHVKGQADSSTSPGRAKSTRCCREGGRRPVDRLPYRQGRRAHKAGRLLQEIDLAEISLVYPAGARIARVIPSSPSNGGQPSHPIRRILPCR